LLDDFNDSGCKFIMNFSHDFNRKVTWKFNEGFG
jgi:hypothetical protein